MNRQTPSGSQTVGPYFRIGLQYLIDRMEEVNADIVDTIEIRGTVLDRDGVPVPDAMLEFWSAGAHGKMTQEIPDGFRRVATDENGGFTLRIPRPVATQVNDAETHAPHMLVLFYARGLLRHLISRVYLQDESANACDAVLQSVPEDRRHTLIAKLHHEKFYRWDVILQGTNETVFFAW
jgi:protocatechuate 3,4-dioxygenase, alpha subunit